MAYYKYIIEMKKLRKIEDELNKNKQSECEVWVFIGG